MPEITGFESEVVAGATISDAQGRVIWEGEAYRATAEVDGRDVVVILPIMHFGPPAEEAARQKMLEAVS